MELVQTAFRILYNLTFEIDGYDQDIHSHVTLAPLAQTNDLINKYQILPKKQKNTFTFLIETIPDGPEEEKPKIGLDENSSFLFQLKPTNEALFSFTHLGEYDFVSQVLVISNEAGNVDGGIPLLSAVIPTYSNSDSYDVGFVVESGGSLFRALQPSSSGDPHGTGESAFWTPESQAGISQADLKDRTSLPYTIDLNTIMVFEIKHSSVLDPEYRLLDGSSKCREITYLIRLYSKN